MRFQRYHFLTQKTKPRFQCRLHTAFINTGLYRGETNEVERLACDNRDDVLSYKPRIMRYTLLRTAHYEDFTWPLLKSDLHKASYCLWWQRSIIGHRQRLRVGIIRKLSRIVKKTVTYRLVRVYCTLRKDCIRSEIFSRLTATSIQLRTYWSLGNAMHALKNILFWGLLLDFSV